jgi:NAD(P)-dependent dehydrogenase (short-subunit alcohol dehydrogenase family)
VTPPNISILNNLFDLTGRHALITGGGGGIGAALSAGFATYGADIACIDLTEEIAQRGAAQAQAAGRCGLAIACDVREPEEVDRAVAKVLDKFGSIEILVNLAGKGVLKPAAEFTLYDWEQTVNTYLRGTFLFCKAVGKGMCEQRRGSIINVSSVSSVVALGRGTAAYGAVKAGVNALTRELALEWAQMGVRVNAIAPCQIDTPQLHSVLTDPQFDQDKLMRTWLEAIPIGRLGKPEDLMGPCIFLASDASGLVTGHVLMADGGYTIK